MLVPKKRLCNLPDQPGYRNSKEDDPQKRHQKVRHGVDRQTEGERDVGIAVMALVLDPASRARQPIRIGDERLPDEDQRNEDGCCDAGRLVLALFQLPLVDHKHENVETYPDDDEGLGKPYVLDDHSADNAHRAPPSPDGHRAIVR